MGLLDGLSKQSIEQLEQLRKQLRERKNNVLPLVGSGLSQGLPSWKELLTKLISLVPEDDQPYLTDLLAKEKYLELVDGLETFPGIGTSLIAKQVERFYRRDNTRGIKEPEAFGLITQWNVTQFATTNYDHWLKDAVAKKLGFAPQIITPKDNDALGDIRAERDGLVFMLHGDADVPTSCVLSGRSYRKLQYASPAFVQALRGLFAQRHVVFIGHSLSDPDLQAILDAFQHEFHPAGSSPKHWFLSTGISKFLRQSLLDKGVEAIEYGPTGDYSKLPFVLRWLGAKEGDAEDD